MLVTVTSNPAVDRVLHVARLSPGEVHRASWVVLQAGGKGLNCARAARTLGEKVLAVGPLAGITGKHIARLAEEEELPCSWFWLDTGESRNCLLLVHEGMDATVINEQGPVVADWEPFLAHARASCRHAGAVALCGSLPPGVPALALAELAGSLEGSSVYVDTSGEALRQVLRRPSGLCIKVNRQELEDSGYSPGAVLSAGAAALLVTRGAHGVDVHSPEGFVHVPARPVQAVSTVGAGDCLLAGLAVGRLRGMPWHEAAALGVTCAAASCLDPIPGRMKPLEHPGP
ncbi:MAG: hypothetical protein HY319_15995 [Armatimonadetes bacterium]|nr:hypothetical protein [Armatimonadota bacterium]